MARIGKNRYRKRPKVTRFKQQRTRAGREIRVATLERRDRKPATMRQERQGRQMRARRPTR